MLDDPDFYFEVKPSLVLRPRPSYYAGSEPGVLLGGKPQLPSHLDWPAGLSFYAQINLEKVSTAFDFDDTHWRMGLPETGTLFVFLPLEDPFDGRARVLYCEDDVSNLPESEPTETLPDLRAGESQWSSYWVDPVGLSDCGRFLYRQQADLLPFLSAYSVNGLWANLEDEAGNPDYVEQNKSTQALEKASLAAAFKAHPFPPAPDTSKVCSGFGTYEPIRSGQTFSLLKPATMNWEFVFDFSKDVFRQSQSLGCQYALRCLRENEPGKRMRGYLVRKSDAFSARASQIRQDTHQPKSKATLREKLRQLRALRRAKRRQRFDDRARAWMDVARHQSGLVPTDIAALFWALVDEIHEFEVPKRSKLNLKAIDSWIRETELGYFDVRQIGKYAMNAAQHHLVIEDVPDIKETGPLPHEVLKLTRDAELAKRYWDEKVRDEVTSGSQSGPHNFSMGPQNTQMLGAPFAVQPQVDEMADSLVMLLQIAGDCGMQITPPDGNFQIWIHPDDLKNRAFNKASWTYFYS